MLSRLEVVELGSPALPRESCWGETACTLEATGTIAGAGPAATSTLECGRPLGVPWKLPCGTSQTRPAACQEMPPGCERRPCLQGTCPPQIQHQRAGAFRDATPYRRCPLPRFPRGKPVMCNPDLRRFRTRPGPPGSLGCGKRPRGSTPPITVPRRPRMVDAAGGSRTAAPAFLVAAAPGRWTVRREAERWRRVAPAPNGSRPTSRAGTGSRARRRGAP